MALAPAPKQVEVRLNMESGVPFSKCGCHWTGLSQRDQVQKAELKTHRGLVCVLLRKWYQHHHYYYYIIIIIIIIIYVCVCV